MLSPSDEQEFTEQFTPSLLSSEAALPFQTALSLNKEVARMLLAKLEGKEAEIKASESCIFFEIPFDPENPDASERVFEQLEKILGTPFPRLHFPRPRLRELRLLDAGRLNPAYFEKTFGYALGAAERAIVSNCPQCTLLAVDLDKLEPAKWLNDAVINFFIEVYKSNEFVAESRARHSTALPREAFALVNTYFSAYLDTIDRAILDCQNNAELLEGALQELVHRKIAWVVARKRLDLTAQPVLLLPYFRKSHWNLYVVLDLDQVWRAATAFLAAPEADTSQLADALAATTVSCFALDSLYQNATDHRLNFLTIRFVLQALLLAMLARDFQREIPLVTPIFTSDNFRTEVLRSVMQNNAVDCGPALLQNLENVIQFGFPALRGGHFEQLFRGESHSSLQQKRVHLIEFVLELERGAALSNVIAAYVRKSAAFQS